MAKDGAPGDISALAQTTDGTLWIAGRTGLTRFDGTRFTSYPGPGDDPLPSTNLASLVAAPDGGLWMGFRMGGVGFLKAGHLVLYGEREGMPGSSVEQFAWDRDGSLWAASRLGLAHFRGKVWEQVTQENQMGAPYGVLVDRAGALWVASLKGLFARVAGETRFREVEGTAGFRGGKVVLATSPDGRIWVAPEGHDVMRIDHPADLEHVGLVTVHGIGRGPLLFDAEGNLWGADARGETLLRAVARDVTRADAPDMTIHPERLSRSDGLAPGPIAAALSDREGNVWIGTYTGLERFTRSNVVGDVAPSCTSNLSTSAAVAPGDDGGLWIACNDDVMPTVTEIHNGVIVSRQRAPAFSLAYRDPGGTVWFGGWGVLAHLENGRLVTTPLPSQVHDRPVQALLQDSRGAMWVSVTRRSLYRFFDGEWSEYGNLDGLPGGFPLAEAEGGGSLWFGYTNSVIARVTGNRVELFDATRGLDVGNVQVFLVRDGQLWVGGEIGLARFDGTRFQSVRSSSATSFRGLSGIVGALNGDLWLNGANGVVHVARREIERVTLDPTYRVECETFNYLDGMPGAAIQIRPSPSAIRTSDGRIWFLTTGGIVSIDATHLARNSLPPPVTIWSVTSGSTRYPNTGATLLLPVQSTSLQIEYTAGSLTIPERVRFRYKLEGSDRQWQEVGSRREALYTNLGPGHYKFRVTAANNDGVWNNTGTSIEFTISPTFYQTAWFYALCGVMCLGLLTASYKMRMRQVAAQVRGRLEARLAERERIARDLHDTLLQGMQGLIWKFQAVADRIPRNEPARELMEQSLDRADKLLAEGRDRVKDLRPSASTAADLAQALAAECEQFAQMHAAEFRVSVQGARRDLHPMVREEGFLIAREAVGNAFQHARAADIEIDVTYGDAALHIRVRDNGVGIDTDVVEAGGRSGHFGFLGMRERATKLGARVEIWSKPGAGTEVDLRVPSEVAYIHSRRTLRAVGMWLISFRSSGMR